MKEVKPIVMEEYESENLDMSISIEFFAFFELSGFRGKKPKDFLIVLSSTMKTLLISTLTEETKLVVSENYALEYAGLSKLTTIIDVFGVLGVRSQEQNR